MSDTPPIDPDKGVNLLALDGGGIKGISTLVILDAIMKAVQAYEIKSKLNTKTYDRRPVDYFHMAAGTSTGGIIALMLFRMQMSIKDTIDSYEKIGPAVFGSAGESFRMKLVTCRTFPHYLLSLSIRIISEQNWAVELSMMCWSKLQVFIWWSVTNKF
jgi:patatin-like phospholipase/acyl hydrolase